MTAVMQSDLVRRHRLTVEEYLRMAEIGLLAPQAHVELIEVKLPLYARHDIPEVWIVDVAQRCIHFFHAPEAGQYAHTHSTPAPGAVSIQALAGATLDLTGFFED